MEKASIKKVSLCRDWYMFWSTKRLYQKTLSKDMMTLSVYK